MGEVRLRNHHTTALEVAPVITSRTAVMENSGTYRALVIGSQHLSFSFGDFLSGDAQSFTAKGYFDPSPVANAGPNIALESGTTGTLLATGTDVDLDALTYSWKRILGSGT